MARSFSATVHTSRRHAGATWCACTSSRFKHRGTSHATGRRACAEARVQGARPRHAGLGHTHSNAVMPWNCSAPPAQKGKLPVSRWYSITPAALRVMGGGTGQGRGGRDGVRMQEPRASAQRLGNAERPGLDQRWGRCVVLAALLQHPCTCVHAWQGNGASARTRWAQAGLTRHPRACRSTP